MTVLSGSKLSRLSQLFLSLKDKDWSEFYYVFKPLVIYFALSAIMNVVLPFHAVRDGSADLQKIWVLWHYSLFVPLIIFCFRVAKVAVKMTARKSVFPVENTVTLRCSNGCEHEITFSGRGRITITHKVSAPVDRARLITTSKHPGDSAEPA